MGFEKLFGFVKKREESGIPPMMDVMGENDQVLPEVGLNTPRTVEEMEAHARAYAEKNGPATFRATDPDAIDYVVPDMSGIGKPTQERSRFKESTEVVQAGEDAIEWQDPSQLPNPEETAWPQVKREGFPLSNQDLNTIEWQDPSNLPGNDRDSVDGWDGRLQEGRDEAAFKQNHRDQP